MAKKKEPKKTPAKRGSPRAGKAAKASSLGTCHSSDGQKWVVIVTTDGEVRADRID